MPQFGQYHPAVPGPGFIPDCAVPTGAPAPGFTPDCAVPTGAPAPGFIPARAVPPGAPGPGSIPVCRAPAGTPGPGFIPACCAPAADQFPWFCICCIFVLEAAPMNPPPVCMPKPMPMNPAREPAELEPAFFNPSAMVLCTYPSRIPGSPIMAPLFLRLIRFWDSSS